MLLLLLLLLLATVRLNRLQFAFTIAQNYIFDLKLHILAMAIYLYSASIVLAVLAIQTNFDINIKCICDHHLPWKEILKLSVFGDISSIATKFREKKRIQSEASPLKKAGSCRN